MNADEVNLTWRHSSLLGAKINADVCCCTADALEFRTFWITGIANAAVLPDPVRARSKTSLPSRKSGIAFSWIIVGEFQLNLAIALGRKKNYEIDSRFEWS